MAILMFFIIVLLAALSLVAFTRQKEPTTSRKSQQAKAMRLAYRSLQGQSLSSDIHKIVEGDPDESTMQISQLWIYPVKSLRGCAVPKAILTREGFYLDRRFMLVKDHGESPRKLENMAIAHFPTMCLFHTAICEDKIIITYRSPGTGTVQGDSLDISVDPEALERLEQVDINMHGSPTTGYDMGERYNEWFSNRFGFKVILVFWGENPRPVLGNLPGKPSNHEPRYRSTITKTISSLPIIGPFLEPDGIIAFNDCAPYLVISDSSIVDVTGRLPEGVEMDLTKFRANIVLKGSNPAYEEDFWGELSFGDGGAKIFLTANCGRCQSLNVDYHSGKSGAGKDGKVLQLLQKDRRVDPGMKYSPIFGRYGFVNRGGEGCVLGVGDEVIVSGRNVERTRFCEFIAINSDS